MFCYFILHFLIQSFKLLDPGNLFFIAFFKSLDICFLFKAFLNMILDLLLQNTDLWSFVTVSGIEGLNFFFERINLRAMFIMIMFHLHMRIRKLSSILREFVTCIRMLISKLLEWELLILNLGNRCGKVSFEFNIFILKFLYFTCLLYTSDAADE